MSHTQQLLDLRLENKDQIQFLMWLQLELYRTSTTVIECAQAVASIKWGTQGDQYELWVSTDLVCLILLSQIYWLTD